MSKLADFRYEILNGVGYRYRSGCLNDYTIELVKILKNKYAKIKAKWFKKGQMSVKRRNESGCCCIINDDDIIEELCGAHEDYFKELKDKLKYFEEYMEYVDPLYLHKKHLDEMKRSDAEDV